MIDPIGALVFGITSIFAADEFVVKGGEIIVPELEYIPPD